MKPVAILSLILSVMIVMQPVVPFLEYYTFKTYIIKNLCVNRDKPDSCCQGKCYLQKQLKEASPDDMQKEKAPVKTKTKNLEFKLPEMDRLFVWVPELFSGFSFLEVLSDFTCPNRLFRPPDRYFLS